MPELTAPMTRLALGWKIILNALTVHYGDRIVDPVGAEYSVVGP
jgi:hypothetical protein